MTARSMGAPLSMRSIHASLKDKGYTMMDYEEESALVKKEGPNEPSKTQEEKGSKNQISQEILPAGKR